MKQPILYAFLVLSLAIGASLPAAQAQISADGRAYLEEMEDTIALLAHAIVNDSLEENRFGACREMIPRLVNALKVKHSFEYPFEQLKAVSVQYPQDSSFRIFTWQLYVNENEYRYYGAIQLNSPELQLFPLVDRSFEVRQPEQAVLSPEQWYGAVYYNLKQVGRKENRYYLLFGFDGNELFRKRKLIEVLRFVDGKPKFGAPVFEHGAGKVKHRIVREYAAEVGTRLNYDEALEIIIFDHLIAQNGPYGEGLNFYPDGSYEGYELTKAGKWAYIEKVFDQVSEEAPRPAPILDNRKKDIFGRGNK